MVRDAIPRIEAARALRIEPVEHGDLLLEVIRRSLNERKALTDNLKDTQARCTELLEDARSVKKTLRAFFKEWPNPAGESALRDLMAWAAKPL